MSVPRVYAAISAITAELAGTGIAKAHVNQAGQYAYRSIDDVMQSLAPLLAKHQLCILPRVLERVEQERRGVGDDLLLSVALRVAFDFVCACDGSSHTVEAYGEALDNGDKATSKAMSAAFKQAVLQAFCIPTSGSEEADAKAPRLKVNSEVPDPDQGWDQWAFDIQEMIRVCESEEALERVQGTYRALFHAASRRRPDIYDALGSVMRARRAELNPQLPLPRVKLGKPARSRRKGNGAAQAEAAHA